MKLSLTPLPPYRSKPGTNRYQFFYNGVKILVEETPQGTWKTWIDILQEKSIELPARTKEEAEEALKKLLLQHFEALVIMLKVGA